MQVVQITTFDSVSAREVEAALEPKDLSNMHVC